MVASVGCRLIPSKRDLHVGLFLMVAASVPASASLDDGP